jgi:hypothetical protein
MGQTNNQNKEQQKHSNFKFQISDSNLAKNAHKVVSGVFAPRTRANKSCVLFFLVDIVVVAVVAVVLIAVKYSNPASNKVNK